MTQISLTASIAGEDFQLFSSLIPTHIRSKSNENIWNPELIFETKVVIFTARNTNIYKICKLHRAIFSSFYNISQPNFTVLLILRRSF
jgi:hypothetical protein